MKIFLIQLIYHLISFYKYFMEIQKNYLTDKTRFFPPPSTYRVWLGNTRWFENFLFLCKEKSLKMISMKYLIFYQCSSINLSLKQRPKMRSSNYRKLSKFTRNSASGCAGWEKSLKPETHPAMVHIQQNWGGLTL